MEQLSLFGIAPDAAARPRLPDQASRDRITGDLAVNLLVEAGAGAGKTTEMVRRMVALVRSGTARVDEIAAVTFTRKAAAELRERFQTALEKELRASLSEQALDTAARLDAALRSIDQSFLGTIHAFCARLLRERPLDAGLDPAFRETLGGEEIRLRRRFWHGYVERLTLEARPEIRGLADVGLTPPQLTGLFEVLAAQPDVEYPAQREARPDASAVRRRIESIMDRAASHLPREEPRGGWDRLQATLRMLRFHRFVIGWSDDVRFLDIVAELRPSSFAARKARWPDGAAAKELERELVSLFSDDGAAAGLVRRWWAHRYPAALSFARDAAHAYEQERVRTGALNFQDLLIFAARLLRESPTARRELSDRYRFLLVDEFQDTDPIQAEVLFLLASDEELDLFDAAVTDAHDAAREDTAFAAWRHLTPRPGALFVVGDPKQSIYRFRRADMTLYQQVKRRFTTFGAVLELTANFRSRSGIGAFVNETFVERFPAESTDVQARFAPMQVQSATATPAPPAEGVFWYELDDPVHGRVQQLARQDADRVATWIAERVRRGERSPGEFLLLTANTKWLARYAAALEARNVPVQVTGASVGGPDSIELDELRLLLRALHDPGDASLTVAVLVGLCFGLDYEQLTAHTEAWAPVGGLPRRAPFSFTSAWANAGVGNRARAGDTARFLAADATAAVGPRRGRDRGPARHPAVCRRRRPRREPRRGTALRAGYRTGRRTGGRRFARRRHCGTGRGARRDRERSTTGAGARRRRPSDEPAQGQGAGGQRRHPGHAVRRLVAATDRAGSARADRTRTRLRNGEERRTPDHTVTLARPADWPDHEAEEQRFNHAEEQRLLYVAASRAAHELVIGCAYNVNSPSRWRSFHPWLQRNTTRLELPQPARPPRQELEVTAGQLQDAVEHTAAARARHGQHGYRAATVSARKIEVRTLAAAPADATSRTLAAAPAEATSEPAAVDHGADDAPVRRGTDWGSAVHDGLQYAAQGMSGAALRDACRNRLVALDRPLDAAGQPAELDELLTIIAAVLDSPLWQRALAAGSMLVEASFAVPFSAAEYAALTGAGPAAPDAPGGDTHGSNAPAPDAPALEVVDGRIDLVFREADGWVLVDYKSDAAGDRVPADLLRSYQGQLILYAAAWRRATGEPVTETALHQVEPEIPPLLHGRHAMLHPDGRRRVEQVVVEELLHAHGPVLPVHHPPQAMRLAVVVQHPDRLAEPAQRDEILDALVPRHRAVLVVVQHEQRRVDLVRPEDGRVLDVAHGRFPQRCAEPALCPLVLELPDHARLPADAAVGADHVDDGCARFRRGEDVRLRHEVRNLVAAP
jgi:ATP-dependent helicase/nuclease subunit A